MIKVNIDVFKEILDSNRVVVQNAKHVKIDYEKLSEFSKSVSINANEHWLNKLPFGINTFSFEEIVNFLLIYHTIGFSYWADNKWSVNYESNRYDGAIGLICSITKEIRKNKQFLNFNYLRQLSFEKFKIILAGTSELPLLKERYNNLMEVSEIVCDNMKSNFYEYIKDINNDVELFNIIIKNFKSYEDISLYNDKEVFYYKRAQLLVSDILHIKHEKLNQEVCYENLIGCADYKIPQVLRKLEITIYDKELENLIDNKQVLEVGSIYEVEIRSTMLIIIDLIKKQKNNKYSAIAINDYIWMQSQKNIDINKPYHRTRTTAY